MVNMDLATFRFAKTAHHAAIPIAYKNRKPRSLAKISQVYAAGSVIGIVSIDPICFFDQLAAFRKSTNSSIRIFKPQTILRLVTILEGLLRNFVANSFVWPRGKPG